MPIFIFFVCILIAIANIPIVFAAAAPPTQTSVDPSSPNFKSYTDPAGRFTIDYPSDASVLSPKGTDVQFRFNYEAPPSEVVVEIELSVIGGETLDQVMGEIDKELEEITPVSGSPSYFWDCDSYTLDGYRACHIDWVEDLDSEFLHVRYTVSQIGDQVYKIRYSATRGDYVLYEAIFVPMINSFKILDHSSSNAEADATVDESVERLDILTRNQSSATTNQATEAFQTYEYSEHK